MVVCFQMTLANRRSWRRYLAVLEADVPVVPRVGEDVEIGDGGWSEPVKAVWHTPHAGKVSVELGGKTMSGAVEFDPDERDGEDLRAFAREAGWTVS